MVVRQLEFDLGFSPQIRGGRPRLASALFDTFAMLNLDFDLIAATELGEALVMGIVAAQKPGTRLERHEAYRGACQWCRSINGKVFTVVSPSKPDKNGDTEIWVGKTNVGRAAEMWWPAAGLQHIGCRGGWTVLPDQAPPGADHAFVKWMDDEIAKLMPKRPDYDDEDDEWKD
jgi:hypothetical protein